MGLLAVPAAADGTEPAGDAESDRHIWIRARRKYAMDAARIADIHAVDESAGFYCECGWKSPEYEPHVQRW